MCVPLRESVCKIEDGAVMADTYVLLHRGSSEKVVKYVRWEGDDTFKKLQMEVVW